MNRMSAPVVPAKPVMPNAAAAKPNAAPAMPNAAPAMPTAIPAPVMPTAVPAAPGQPGMFNKMRNTLKGMFGFSGGSRRRRGRKVSRKASRRGRKASRKH